MPIYEYECCKCSQVTEALQKFSDPPLKKCPHCGGKMNKLMSLGSFHLKGDGWYVTDYRGKNSSTTATATTDAPKEEKKDTKKKAKKTSDAGGSE